MNNIEKFANVMSNRMKMTSRAAVTTTIELATVNANLSITPDSLRAAIPKGDYMINLMLTGGTTTSSESHTHSGADHSHSGGSHSHKLPDAFRGIQPRDRVLIAWCGNTPVVIAVAVSS